MLAEFWKSVAEQDEDRFSERILKKFFVFNYAPNGMWQYFVSVYFMKYHDKQNKLDDEKFYNFLNKAMAFIWAYAITNPGVNALRTPVFNEMINIVNDIPVTFDGFKFNIERTESMFYNFAFYNQKPITKSMLTWWAFENKEQDLIEIDTVYEIEHIYAKNRNEKEHSLTDSKNVEKLGNKSLLEKRINIRASDYRFSDKKSYYEGYTTKRGQIKEATRIKDLLELAKKDDFVESSILDRDKLIISSFMNYLVTQGLND